MKRVTLGPQRVRNAGRFFEILSHPDFVFFPFKPKSVEEVKAMIRNILRRQREGFLQKYSVLYDEEIVGTIGLKIDQHRKHIGELDFFLDRNFWGRGIIPAAVRLIEKIAVEDLGIRRLEIATTIGNRAAQRVAVKCGYRREGIQRGKLLDEHGKQRDGYLFAKVVGK
jgi:[ribosomal protein S5]-alanine N-acetyltransferase